MDNNPLWYKDAVFYEVYIRAYRDSNGSGSGDLKGLTEKLDYLEDLGVDCIWMLPIYPSPLVDDGYDIADFYGIHPDYGTIEDFKTLVNEAHTRGIRVIADLVINHTSDQHPWFKAAVRIKTHLIEISMYGQIPTKSILVRGLYSLITNHPIGPGMRLPVNIFGIVFTPNNQTLILTIPK